MKKVLLLVSIFLTSASLFAQDGSPFSFRTEYNADYVNNFDGGGKKVHSYIGKISLSASFETEKAGWYKGGKFFVQAINAHGGSPSSYVGDIQPVSRIEASNRIGLFEFWYRQDIGKLSILFGQFDMNSTFAVNSLAGNLLNTSFGMYPSVALNMPLAIYPSAHASLFAAWKQSEKITIQAAVFEGTPLSHAENPNNLSWNIKPGKGLFYTAEFQYKEIENEMVKGNFKLGGYYHSGTFQTIVDPLKSEKGNYGVYITANRLLLRENTDDDQGISGFVQLGGSRGNVNMVDFYSSGGISYKGLITSRTQDILSLGVVHSSINNVMHENFENVAKSRNLLELNYKAILGKHFYLQPDIQYIINPGANLSLDNAFVGILRFTVQY